MAEREARIFEDRCAAGAKGGQFDLFAQFERLNFAGGGFGKLLVHHLFRRFEPGWPLAGNGGQVGFGQLVLEGWRTGDGSPYADGWIGAATVFWQEITDDAGRDYGDQWWILDQGRLRRLASLGKVDPGRELVIVTHASWEDSREVRWRGSLLIGARSGMLCRRRWMRSGGLWVEAASSPTVRNFCNAANVWFRETIQMSLETSHSCRSQCIKDAVTQPVEGGSRWVRKIGASQLKAGTAQIASLCFRDGNRCNVSP